MKYDRHREGRKGLAVESVVKEEFYQKLQMAAATEEGQETSNFLSNLKYLECATSRTSLPNRSPSSFAYHVFSFGTGRKVGTV